MNIRLTCKGLEHTDDLDAHVKKQLGKIIKFLEAEEHSPISIDMVLHGHATFPHHEVHLHVTAPQFKGIARREGDHLFQVIDETIEVVYRELLREKERHVDNKKNRGPHRGL